MLTVCSPMSKSKRLQADTKYVAIADQKRAFVHWYVGEGMEEGEFSGASLVSCVSQKMWL